MAAPTQQFNTSKGGFAATIRHTLNMVSGKDVANYTLLFMDPTDKHPAGSHESIFNPSIVLGRGGNCQVKYDDRYKTVSREHACIAASGGKHIIFHNPSAKNPTLVNGTAVSDSQDLNNGDEVQLSNDGPRFRYNTAEIKSSTMGLTSRMGIALSQATKPYKRAMIVMFIALLAALCFGGFNLYKNIRLDNVSAANTTKVEGLLNEKIVLSNQIAELEQKENVNSEKVQSLKNKLNKTEKNLEDYKNETAQINAANQGGNTTATTNFDNIPWNDIYYIYAQKIEITINGELSVLDARANNPWNKSANIWGGTGFLTVGGKFITARHVVQPWRYPNNVLFNQISAMESKGGSVNVIFEALSRTGDKFNFTSKNIQFDDSRDEMVNSKFEIDGQEVEFIKKEKTEYSSDWAYVEFGNRKGTIKLNTGLSKSLKTGSSIYPVGFSNTKMHQPTSNDLKQLISNCMVIQDELTNGLIKVSGGGFGQGNSGGPVFANVNGQFQAIGIVSAGLGTQANVIVPVVNIW